MITNNTLVLATDLDGTFLGGSPQERQDFYNYLRVKRDRLLLIFVTGRSLELTLRLYEEKNLIIPRPDYIIGDVGTTVYEGKTLKPVAKVQNWIADIWGNSSEFAGQILVDEPGLTLQTLSPQYRVSYYYKPDQNQERIIQKIQAAGFECIMSADKYLDILPKGVAKGSTLLKLIDWLNISPYQVITSGDSLNDLSLFETGLKSIAVGNSELKLVEKIKTLNNVYYSDFPGVTGIWDGIKYYDQTF
ncbi:MAG TPA: alpha,alpha-trehalose-phosphate synthase [Planktothrix sp. UBA8407]|jgi:HAD-superfamily hydrolase, subfamily IIB|nr:alpha,alpha-trehalose-phosphate synthase [Planktothrix sp. UBA8407]HBK22780.1 alpha,alpha-trehalose-phosphate synthase [Planktothrix sp. UBA10369]